LYDTNGGEIGRRTERQWCDGPVATDDGHPPGPLTKQDFEALARFRFGIRRYLRFSEETVRSHGLTPQHYQLLLALKGYPGREWATVRELADRLQLRHHSVVELVNRAQGQGLVERASHPGDARAVRVLLTADGERILARLSALHRDELRRMGTTLVLPTWHDDLPDGEPARREG
jgi:DNA-binding MarR family transcriptional regulator